VATVPASLDPNELLDSHEVAEVLGLSRFNAVSTYRRRYSDFPSPIVEKGRCLLWLRADIVQWRRAHPSSTHSEV